MKTINKKDLNESIDEGIKNIRYKNAPKGIGRVNYKKPVDTTKRHIPDKGNSKDIKNTPKDTGNVEHKRSPDTGKTKPNVGAPAPQVKSDKTSSENNGGSDEKNNRGEESLYSGDKEQIEFNEEFIKKEIYKLETFRKRYLGGGLNKTKSIFFNSFNILSHAREAKKDKNGNPVTNEKRKEYIKYENLKEIMNEGSLVAEVDRDILLLLHKEAGLFSYELKEFDPESLYRKIGSVKRGKGGKKFFSTLMNMAGMGDWVKLGDSIKNFYNTFSQDNHSEKGKLKMYEDQNEMIMKELLNSIELEFNKEERIKKELRHFDLESRNIDDLYIELFTILNNVVNLYYEAISKKIFLLRQNLKSKYKSYY